MFLMNYPFAERLYPGALEVLKRLRDFGPTVLLLEGDTVFQPGKIERAGLVDAVEGRSIKGKSRTTSSGVIQLNATYLSTTNCASLMPSRNIGENASQRFLRDEGLMCATRTLRLVFRAPDVTINRLADLLSDLPRLWVAPQPLPLRQSAQ